MGIGSGCFKRVMIVCEIFSNDVEWLRLVVLGLDVRLSVVRDILTLRTVDHSQNDGQINAPAVRIR